MTNYMKLLRLILLLHLTIISVVAMTQESRKIEPLRLAVAGVSHGHVSWILGHKDSTVVKLVGVFEKDAELGKQYQQRFRFSEEMLYSNLEEMLKAVKPEAVVAFGSIFDHLSVVEACAPLGIHVMVEKPLAISNDHAAKMKALADRHKIHLLTNYETSWYPATEKTLQLVKDSAYIGNVRKAVFHHGHEGPKEIGVGADFLKWLTDPKENGGGALIDFGCYGANIMTRLMNGELPESVTAVTRQYKPDTYPKVDDDATIIVNYSNAQAIIQASWNWPFNRKDMQVYGSDGYIITYDDRRMAVRNKSTRQEVNRSYSVKEAEVFQDPFKYFAYVVRGIEKVSDTNLYSLANNMTVVKILDAARQSASTGKTVRLSDR